MLFHFIMQGNLNLILKNSFLLRGISLPGISFHLMAYFAMLLFKNHGFSLRMFFPDFSFVHLLKSINSVKTLLKWKTVKWLGGMANNFPFELDLLMLFHLDFQRNVKLSFPITMSNSLFKNHLPKHERRFTAVVYSNFNSKWLKGNSFVGNHSNSFGMSYSKCCCQVTNWQSSELNVSPIEIQQNRKLMICIELIEWLENRSQ